MKTYDLCYSKRDITAVCQMETKAPLVQREMSQVVKEWISFQTLPITEHGKMRIIETRQVGRNVVLVKQDFKLII